MTIEYRWLENPIDPFIKLKDDADLGVPRTRNAGLRAATQCVAANAILAHFKDAPSVHYSRDNTHYAKRTSWVPDWYSRRNLVRATDALLGAGLIDCQTTKPSPAAWYRSNFSARPALLQRVAAISIFDFEELARPSVELRDRRTKQFVSPENWLSEDAEAFVTIATDVHEQNDLLMRVRIELARRYPRTSHGLIAVGPLIINPLKRRLRRIFLDSCDLGGRWYGGWWQNIPGCARSFIRINGEATREVDYSACQLRLAYGVAGFPDPLGGEVDQRRIKRELYGIAGVERPVAKQAFLIMLNARDQASAEKAVAEWLRDQEIECPNGRLAEARRIVCAVRDHFPEIGHLFFSDLGLRLQRFDSDICADVQRAFRAQGIVVLSVHDSFIIAARHEEALRDAMMTAFRDGMRCAHAWHAQRAPA